jgi:hypothetical protein
MACSSIHYAEVSDRIIGPYSLRLRQPPSTKGEKAPRQTPRTDTSHTRRSTERPAEDRSTAGPARNTQASQRDRSVAQSGYSGPSSDDEVWTSLWNAQWSGPLGTCLSLQLQLLSKVAIGRPTERQSLSSRSPSRDFTEASSQRVLWAKPPLSEPLS